MTEARPLSGSPVAEAAALLEARGVHVTFHGHGGPVPAVRGLDLTLARNETLALVGESGSGKSAFARALLRMNAPPFTRHRATVSGSARLAGAGDLIAATESDLRGVRARRVAMIFQDALSALNPVMRAGRQVEEALAMARPGLDRAARRAEVGRLFAEVALPEPAALARRYPHQLSGGQRQRVVIALALARASDLLIADEPTTALDVTVQARILRLLGRLRQERGMAMLFITHDLGVVSRIADRVAVMYAGQIVELAPRETLFAAPRHPYTRGLLASRPGRRRPGERLTGTAPDPREVGPGCAFAPRCLLAEAACSAHQPLRQVGPAFVRCWKVPA